MKRLFCVRNQNGKPVCDDVTGEPIYFDDKMIAKKVRDHVNEGRKPGNMCFISKGPDHMGAHGHSVARMRRQPKEDKNNG